MESVLVKIETPPARVLDERDRVADGHGPDLPYLPGVPGQGNPGLPPMLPLTAGGGGLSQTIDHLLTFTGDRAAGQAIDTLLRTAQPLGEKEWAETGGPDGGGTRNAPDPADGLTGTQFISLATGIGAGAGAAIVIETIGIPALAGAGVAGAGALMATGAALLGGFAATGVLSYQIGTILNNTDFVQGLSNKFTDLLVHGPTPEQLEPFKHILTPNVTPVGPWPIEMDVSAPTDKMLFFTFDPGDTEVVLYDTMLEAAMAELQGFNTGFDMFALWFLP